MRVPTPDLDLGCISPSGDEGTNSRAAAAGAGGGFIESSTTPSNVSSTPAAKKEKCAVPYASNSSKKRAPLVIEKRDQKACADRGGWEGEKRDQKACADRGGWDGGEGPGPLATNDHGDASVATQAWRRACGRACITGTMVA